MARFDHSDDSVVVVIGSGAGGGTLANELCQRGIKVVLLEAGKRESPASFVQEEWPSFNQLAWSDPRTASGSWRVAKDFPALPAWICKTVGGLSLIPMATRSRFWKSTGIISKLMTQLGCVLPGRRITPEPRPQM